LENELSDQVKEKQELVAALEKEKNTLTYALKQKLKEIKKERMKVKRRIKTDQEIFGQNVLTPNKKDMHTPDAEAIRNKRNTLHANTIYNPSLSYNAASIQIPNGPKTPSQKDKVTGIEFAKAVEVCDKRIEILQKDNEFYQLQSDKTLHKILMLNKQLEDAKEEANRCIR
jgi:hypothetical protein